MIIKVLLIPAFVWQTIATILITGWFCLASAAPLDTANVMAPLRLTSQGIPFLHAGDEMLRSKQGDHNSYQSPDSINAIRWNWRIENRDTVDYYRQAIALRKNHPGFRMTSWDKVHDNIASNQPRYGVVVNRINAQANGDDWKNIIVIYNSADNYEYPLPSGTWKVAMERSDSKSGNDRPVTGKVIAEGTSVTILHQ